jgi:hypothetical protein
MVEKLLNEYSFIYQAVSPLSRKKNCSPSKRPNY